MQIMKDWQQRSKSLGVLKDCLINHESRVVFLTSFTGLAPIRNVSLRCPCSVSVLYLEIVTTIDTRAPPLQRKRSFQCHPYYFYLFS